MRTRARTASETADPPDGVSLDCGRVLVLAELDFNSVHLLQTGNASFDEVASRVGYAEGATPRGLLRRHLNLGVREIRGNSDRRRF